MPERTLAIIGLGMIGGSLAASLRAHHAPWRIRAADRRERALEYARRRGLIDDPAPSPAEAARGADVVLLAAPVGAIRSLLGTLAPSLEPGQVVTDVGSTKASIVAHAEAVLPEGVAFVGGHPIAGTEHSGIEAAVAGLFEGRRCVLTPTGATARPALEAVVALWSSVGAEVSLLAPDVHDRLLARLSHLPNLAAYALVSAATGALEPQDLEFGGGALRDFTRVAQSPATLWRDVCLENREAILGALAEFQGELLRLRDAVSDADGERLESYFQRASEARGSSWRP